MSNDVNVRIPRDMMPVVSHTESMLRFHPRYAAMRLSTTAVIRLALALGLEALQTECRDGGYGPSPEDLARGPAAHTPKPKRGKK